MAEVFEWDLVDLKPKFVQGTYSVYADSLSFSHSPHWGFQTEDKFYDFVSMVDIVFVLTWDIITKNKRTMQ